MRTFSKKRLSVLALVAISTGAVWPQESPQQAEAVSRPHHPAEASTGPTTGTIRAVQLTLKSYGYGLAVDGVQGPQTTKAVLHWQQANGLIVDGIIGPQTLRSLGLVPVPAGVVTNRAPATAVGIPGECESYRSIVEANGLSWSFFGPIMWRESRCTPTAYNGRGADESYGLLQINTKGALWGELQRRCGLSSKDQLFDPATNIACAGALYRAYGTRPWSL